MSYILDALEKSEYERERGGVPGLQSGHHSHSADDGKKSWWKYVLIFVISVNLVLVAVLFYKEGSIVVVSESQSEKNKIGMPASGIQATEIQEKGIAEKPVRPFASKPTVSQAVKQIAKIPEPDSTQDKSVQKKIQTIRASKLEKSGLPVAKETTAESVVGVTGNRLVGESNPELQNVVRISQLPDSVQRNLPDLKYSGHLYSSNPLRRKLIINGRSMKEGEWVNNNVQLSEITMDGAIFSYKEYHYQVELLRNWAVN